LHEITIEDLSAPGIVFQMGLPPRRIDILTGISGIDFDDAWPNHIRADFGEINVPVLGAQDLIENKRQTGRPQDLVDADALSELLQKSNNQKS
ncbi:MAG: hypothetical protein ACNA8W_19620, partial [Bradymonadaceae bacterium]